MDANDTTATQVGAGPPKAPRAIPLAAEILGYVGGALALGAVVALLTAFWEQLGFYGRVGIALGLALAGLLGGWAMSRSGAPAANRLSQFLLFVGVIGAGAAVGFDAYEMAVKAGLGRVHVADSMFGTKAGEWAWFAGFATVAVVGGAVWWRRRTTMQHLAFGLGVGIGTLLLLPLLPVDGPYWGAGATLALVGLIWGALGLKGWLPPENVALALASLGVLGGVQMMYGDYAPVGEAPLRGVLLIGLAVSVAMVVGSILLKRMVLLGFGAAGIVLYAFQLIDAQFHGTIGAPIAMLAAGLLFVGMAVFLAVRLPRMSRREAPAVAPAAARTPIAAGETEAPALTAKKPEPEPIPLAAEILGYVGGAFAVGAAIALMTTFWTPLGLWGRLAIAVIGALLGILGGFAIGRQGSRAAHRLEQFMLAIGTIAVGFFAGIVAYEALKTALLPAPVDQGYDYPGMWAQVVGFLTAAVAGFAVWWRRRTGLQLAVFAAAVAGGVGTASDVLSSNNPTAYWYSGAAFVVLGLLLGLGAVLRFLKPESIAYAIGSVVLFLGLMNLMFDPTTGSDRPAVMWAGLLLSIAMIIASIPMRRAVILGFGAAGVVLWSVNLVNAVFGRRVQGPILLLVIGVVFVAMAVLVAVMLPRFKVGGPGERSTRPPFGPHAGAPA